MCMNYESATIEVLQEKLAKKNLVIFVGRVLIQNKHSEKSRDTEH